MEQDRAENEGISAQEVRKLLQDFDYVIKELKGVRTDEERKRILMEIYFNINIVQGIRGEIEKIRSYLLETKDKKIASLEEKITTNDEYLAKIRQYGDAGLYPIEAIQQRTDGMKAMKIAIMESGEEERDLQLCGVIDRYLQALEREYSDESTLRQAPAQSAGPAFSPEQPEQIETVYVGMEAARGASRDLPFQARPASDAGNIIANPNPVPTTGSGLEGTTNINPDVLAAGQAAVAHLAKPREVKKTPAEMGEELRERIESCQSLFTGHQATQQTIREAESNFENEIRKAQQTNQPATHTQLGALETNPQWIEATTRLYTLLGESKKMVDDVREEARYLNEEVHKRLKPNFRQTMGIAPKISPAAEQQAKGDLAVIEKLAQEAFPETEGTRHARQNVNSFKDMLKKGKTALEEHAQFFRDAMTPVKLCDTLLPNDWSNFLNRWIRVIENLPSIE